jgi:hypothetical protein
VKVGRFFAQRALHAIKVSNINSKLGMVAQRVTDWVTKSSLFDCYRDLRHSSEVLSAAIAELQGSLSSSRPSLMRTDRAFWKRRKGAISIPHTVWATRTVTTVGLGSSRDCELKRTITSCGCLLLRQHRQADQVTGGREKRSRSLRVVVGPILSVPSRW